MREATNELAEWLAEAIRRSKVISNLTNTAGKESVGAASPDAPHSVADIRRMISLGQGMYTGRLREEDFFTERLDDARRPYALELHAGATTGGSR